MVLVLPSTVIGRTHAVVSDGAEAIDEGSLVNSVGVEDLRYDSASDSGERSAANPEEVRKKRIEEYDKLYCNPYRGAERGYIDDVIGPNDTRKYINRALDILENKVEVRPKKKYQNINL